MWRRRRRKRSYLPHPIIIILWDLATLMTQDCVFFFFFDLFFFTSKPTSLINLLQYVVSPLWRQFCGLLISWIWFVTSGESRSCYSAIFLLQAFLEIETFLPTNKEPLADVFEPWLSRLQFDGCCWGEQGKLNATFQSFLFLYLQYVAFLERWSSLGSFCIWTSSSFYRKQFSRFTLHTYIYRVSWHLREWSFKGQDHKEAALQQVTASLCW